MRTQRALREERPFFIAVTSSVSGARRRVLRDRFFVIPGTAAHGFRKAQRCARRGLLAIIATDASARAAAGRKLIDFCRPAIVILRHRSALLRCALARVDRDNVATDIMLP